MNNNKDIMSIIKIGDKYWIYLPYIKVEDELDKRCKWWGEYDTFKECFDVLKEKDEQYNHMVIDPKILRKIKLNKIRNERTKTSDNN